MVWKPAGKWDLWLHPRTVPAWLMNFQGCLFCFHLRPHTEKRNVLLTLKKGSLFLIRLLQFFAYSDRKYGLWLIVEESRKVGRKSFFRKWPDMNFFRITPKISNFQEFLVFKEKKLEKKKQFSTHKKLLLARIKSHHWWKVTDPIISYQGRNIKKSAIYRSRPFFGGRAEFCLICWLRNFW